MAIHETVLEKQANIVPGNPGVDTPRSGSLVHSNSQHSLFVNQQTSIDGERLLIADSDTLSTMTLINVNPMANQMPSIRWAR